MVKYSIQHYILVSHRSRNRCSTGSVQEVGFMPIYFFLFFSSNFSRAYLSIVLGITEACLSRNDSKTKISLLPISRSIHPTALCMRSCLSERKNSASANASLYSFFLMKPKVASMAIRLSHKEEDFARTYNKERSSAEYSPKMTGAEVSTKSQLFTHRLCLRYK